MRMKYITTYGRKLLQNLVSCVRKTTRKDTGWEQWLVFKVAQCVDTTITKERIFCLESLRYLMFVDSLIGTGVALFSFSDAIIFPTY